VVYVELRRVGSELLADRRFHTMNGVHRVWMAAKDIVASGTDRDDRAVGGLRRADKRIGDIRAVSAWAERLDDYVVRCLNPPGAIGCDPSLQARPDDIAFGATRARDRRQDRRTFRVGELRSGRAGREEGDEYDGNKVHGSSLHYLFSSFDHRSVHWAVAKAYQVFLGLGLSDIRPLVA